MEKLQEPLGLSSGHNCHNLPDYSSSSVFVPARDSKSICPSTSMSVVLSLTLFQDGLSICTFQALIEPMSVPGTLLFYKHLLLSGAPS